MNCWMESKDDAHYIRIDNTFLCCLDCGALLFDSRKFQHDKFHEDFVLIQNKLKPKEDYNEG